MILATSTSNLTVTNIASIYTWTNQAKDKESFD